MYVNRCLIEILLYRENASTQVKSNKKVTNTTYMLHNVVFIPYGNKYRLFKCRPTLIIFIYAMFCK
jgi:hypothetical protein